MAQLTLFFFEDSSWHLPCLPFHLDWTIFLFPKNKLKEIFRTLKSYAYHVVVSFVLLTLPNVNYNLNMVLMNDFPTTAPNSLIFPPPLFL